MHFIIAGKKYLVVRIWDLTWRNRKHHGLTSRASTMIWLDGALADDEIVSILRHQVNEGWMMELGRPQASEDFDREFSAQGGLDSLLAIRIQGARPTTRIEGVAPVLDSGGCFNCMRCHVEIPEGNIFQDGQPMKARGTLIYTMPRSCKCSTCGTIHTWMQKATSEGIPLGRVFNVAILAGWQAEEWESAHPITREHYSTC